MRCLEQWERAILSDPARTVCFSGHRPPKLPGNGEGDALSAALRGAVEKEILIGRKIFVNGGMAGFDILAGEAVIALQRKYPDIRCVTAAPFRAGYFKTANWTPDWKERALYVYRASAVAFTLAENYCPGIYYKRDEYMLSLSSVVVCYLNGEITGMAGKRRKGGGTAYTVNRAYDLGLAITNLARTHY